MRHLIRSFIGLTATAIMLGLAIPARADGGIFIDVQLRCESLSISVTVAESDIIAAAGGLVIINDVPVAIGGAVAGNVYGEGSGAGAGYINENGYGYVYVIGDDTDPPQSDSLQTDDADMSVSTDYNGVSTASIVIKFANDGSPVFAYILIGYLSPDLDSSYFIEERRINCSFDGPPLPTNKDGTYYEQKLIICDVAVFDAPNGNAVRDNKLKNGQTWYVGKDTEDAGGESWSPVFVSSYDKVWIPTRCTQ